MSQRNRVAGLVGLAGGVAVAWGLRGLLLTGDCGGEGTPPCPPEAAPYFVAVGVGIPVVILAGIVGRTLAIFGVFPAVAAGAFWAASDLAGGSRATALFLGGTFAAVTAAPFALIPFQARRRQRVLRIMNEGRTAIGTVTAVADTGVTVNLNPRVRITLRIEPEDGSAPFEGVKTFVASRVDLPRPGRRYPVWYDPADRSQFVILTKLEGTAPPHVRRLYEKAVAESAEVRESGSGSVPAQVDPLDRLAKLNELRLTGALTEEEFQAQKAKILGSDGA
ncbi:MAG TPA: SHOCT domain-containing protein [Natronosporangium sp.]|nr:SHOCT domain-containing protein [Natronosporangium sp.]